MNTSIVTELLYYFVLPGIFVVCYRTVFGYHDCICYQSEVTDLKLFDNLREPNPLHK